MAKSYLPPIEFLRECFSYDPETGLFRWNPRPVHHFAAEHVQRYWNTQNAGARAFTQIDPDGYHRAEVRFEGRRVRLKGHRVAFKLMTGLEPENVDHRNLNPLDDRFANLRAATWTDNARNKTGRTDKVLPKGVFASGRKFRAVVHRGGSKVRLGTFDTPAEAHAAYCAYASRHHGEFFNPGPSRPSIFD